MTDLLYHDPALVQFYDIENGWAADTDYCFKLAAPRSSVLDLGCGTGLLAARLAAEKNCDVVGADPAAAMLAVASLREGGDRVTWIEGDARHLRLDRRFDLIVLTGHAFQVFLTREDRAAALATIAHHLKPQGRFIFDSRNPESEEWREWVREQSQREIAHPSLGPVQAWNDVHYDPATAIATYETVYEVKATGQRHHAQSRIAFPSRAELETLIAEAGLRVDEWFAEWSGSAWKRGAKELIPLGRLAG